MPKKKKFPRLPSGFGSIRFLGNGRRLPYAVHPPANERDEMGYYIRPKALCYVPDWYTGFAVLSAYHAGTYKPGMERIISQEVAISTVDLDAFCRRVLADHSMLQGSQCPTFKEAFDQFIDWKFGENAPKQLKPTAKANYISASEYLRPIFNIPLDRIKLDQMQDIVNKCEKGKGVRSRIVLTAKSVYKFAVPRHMCEENIADLLVTPAGRDPVHGVPFSDEDLKKLWDNQDNETAQVLLIMCYSGFRINAFSSNMEINLEQKYFRGGLKSAAGRDRIVPIHSAIYPLVKQRVEKDGYIVGKYHTFRNRMIELFESLGMVYDPPHTPHDCRHTFSALCEKYGVREADRKRLMGHSFGSDITNGIYGHRTLEELREEIEKIKIPYNKSNHM